MRAVDKTNALLTICSCRQLAARLRQQLAGLDVPSGPDLDAILLKLDSVIGDSIVGLASEPEDDETRTAEQLAADAKLLGA